MFGLVVQIKILVAVSNFGFFLTIAFINPPSHITKNAAMNTNRIWNHLRVALKHSVLALAATAGLAIWQRACADLLSNRKWHERPCEWGGEADGYKFTTWSSILVVSWLGFYDAPNGEEGTVGDGLLASHRVSIWRESDGVLMARTTVEPGDTLVGNFRGRGVTPVTLAANTAYVIAADYGGEGDRMQQGDDLTGWGLNGITIQEGRYNGAGGDMPTNTYDLMISANFGYTLAPLTVTLTSPADQPGVSDRHIHHRHRHRGGTWRIHRHRHVPRDAYQSRQVRLSRRFRLDTSSPFSADLGTLPAGTYEIYATVVNTDNPPGTATSATHTFTVVAAIPTTTALAPAGAPTTYGENVTFTATVSPTPTGGTVQFFDGANYLGSPVAVNTVTGEASYSTTTLGAGTREITADYSGHWLHDKHHRRLDFAGGRPGATDGEGVKHAPRPEYRQPGSFSLSNHRLSEW